MMKPSYLYAPLAWQLFVVTGILFLVSGAYLSFVPALYAVGFKYVLWLLVLVHLLEAVYAYRKAVRGGLQAYAAAWALQTLLFGFWTLMLLNKVLRMHQENSEKTL